MHQYPKDQCAPMREIQAPTEEQQRAGFWQNKGKNYPSLEYYHAQIKPREELAQTIIKNSSPKNDTEQGYLVKVTFIGGNQELKKQCMSTSYMNTIGLDFFHTIMNGIKFQIWDFAGQEKFRSITTGYFRGSNILVLFAKDQDEFKTTQAQVLAALPDIVKRNTIMVLAKPQDAKIDFGDFPISGVIDITPENCRDTKFVELIYNIVKDLAGPDAKQSVTPKANPSVTTTPPAPRPGGNDCSVS